MNYSFFLFSKLFDVHFPSEEPYDVQFDLLVPLYNFYEASEYNDTYKGEHECIVDFMSNVKLEKINGTEILMALLNDGQIILPNSYL